MVDPAIHDPVDPIHADFGVEFPPIAAFFAGGERGAAAPAVRLPEVGAEAPYPPSRSPTLAELASAKRVETFLIDDIEQLQRWTVRLFFTLLPFLNG